MQPDLSLAKKYACRCLCGASSFSQSLLPSSCRATPETRGHSRPECGKLIPQLHSKCAILIPLLPARRSPECLEPESPECQISIAPWKAQREGLAFKGRNSLQELSG